MLRAQVLTANLTSRSMRYAPSEQHFVRTNNLSCVNQCNELPRTTGFLAEATSDLSQANVTAALHVKR